MKEKIYKISIISSIVVASMVSVLFVGGAIFGLIANYLNWIFYGVLPAWFIPIGIGYAFRDIHDDSTKNYVPKVPSQFRCNDGFKEVKKENKKTFLVDYDSLGLNCERKNIPVKNNVKVRKRTRND